MHRLMEYSKFMATNQQKRPDKHFFLGNRRILGKRLSGGLVVMTAYDLMQATADQAQSFVQEANFWYLSGIEDARWKIIYDGQRDHTWLVRPSISEIERIFDGEANEGTLRELAGADEIIGAEEFEAKLRDLAKKHNLVHTAMPQMMNESMVHNPAQKNLVDQLKRIFPNVQDCARELALLRSIKQPIEVTMLERAARLSANAFEMAHDLIASCKYEYELEAIFTAEFRRHGAYHAYAPIVAAGARATTLHYIDNNQPIGVRSLVLIDIGARVSGYVADISRTYARGEVSKRRQAVHRSVVEAQSQIIKLLKPGLSIRDYQRSVDAIMFEACQSLGLSAGNEQETVRRYMPHAVGHGLGIDVHDSLGRVEEFYPGVVLTVEPGIYIPEESIGVRIEDDILITDRSQRNLTGSLSTDL